MRGIDVSHWQCGLIPSKLEIDFCIAKATEGVGYVDICGNGFVQNCIENDILWGFYHFARENDPEFEAQFFYDYCKNYFNHGIPILDYETSNYNNVDWCERFIKKVHDLSGVWCVLYISASQCHEYINSWIPEKCGLWLAGYPYVMTDWTDKTIPYNTSPFSVVAIWQFTSNLRLKGYSGNLDGDIAYMDKEAWMKYANSTDYQQNVEKHEIPQISTDDLVWKVLIGECGAGEDRKRMLGDRYKEVQNRINNLYEIAEEVIKGKWGNGKDREQALNNAGYPYKIVQKIVNAILQS